MESKDRIEMPIYVTDKHGNKRQVDSLVFVRERTCELVETDKYTNSRETIHVLECSKCGKTCEHVNGMPNYCPNCGARVVSE